MKSTANRDLSWYAARIDCLAEFMTPQRYEVMRRTLSMRTLHMTVMAENMFHGQNAAALMRHCEAFGVQQMHAVETVCGFQPNRDIVRGTDRWVDLRRHGSSAEAMAVLRAEGYRIVATTPHTPGAATGGGASESVGGASAAAPPQGAAGRQISTPETFDVEHGPFALVFGTEHAGISDELAAGADEFLHIPMCGMVESLNVSASAAILIYMLGERLRRTVQGWRISGIRQAEILYRWMLTSVDDAEAIIQRKIGAF